MPLVHINEEQQLLNKKYFYPFIILCCDSSNKHMAESLPQASLQSNFMEGCQLTAISLGTLSVSFPTDLRPVRASTEDLDGFREQRRKGRLKMVTHKDFQTAGGLNK